MAKYAIARTAEVLQNPNTFQHIVTKAQDNPYAK